MAKKGEAKRKKAAKAKSAAKKPVVKAASVSEPSSGIRSRRLSKKQTRQKNKAQVKERARLPSGFSLVWQSAVFIKRFWRPLIGILLVYALLNLVFANGIVTDANTAVHNIKNTHKLGEALSGFSSVATSSSGQASTMQSVLLILESLVIIWALRHLFAGEKFSVKQAYYYSMAPLVPFLLVVFTIVVQLLPLAITSAILVLVLSTVTGSTAATVLFGILFGLGTLWSLRMVSSSIFALYIVTLPDMEPRRALKSAKNLVAFRRLQLIRKILFLGITVFVAMGIIIVPLIIFAHALVAPMYFVLTMLAVLYTHTYLYSLYKGLLA